MNNGNLKLMINGVKQPIRLCDYKHTMIVMKQV